MTTRRAVLRSGLAAPVAALLGHNAQAQTYPSKPLTIYVGFGPGGAGDLVARRVGQKITELTGQPVIIENRPGAGAAVAATAVLQAKPDGYTLLLSGNGNTISSVLFRKLPYDINKDFRHASTLASFDLGLIVAGNSRFKSAAELLAYARANPGQLSIGTSRIGSTQHLAAEMYKSMAGIEAVSVPYKTTADMLAGLRAGDVQLAFEVISPILGQIQGKSVKVLAVTASSRFSGLPDVPTLAESGVPGFDASSWAGISVPAATPTAVVNELSRILQKALAAPDVQKSLEAMGFEARGSTPEEITLRMRQDVAKWKAVIEKAGVELQ